MADKKKKSIVLIVEDEETSALFLKEMLGDKFDVYLFARNGQQAIDVCKENTDISMILMDIKMPVMNGLIATRKIREFNTTIKIIAQTAYAMLEDEEAALQAGCDDYISKPINEADMRRKIDQLLNL